MTVRALLPVLVLLASTGCASSGYWKNLPEPRAAVPAYAIRGDDPTVVRAVRITRRLASARPLPVELLLVATSDFVNTTVKDARFPATNAGAWRCGEGDPPARGCIVVGTRMLKDFSDDALAGVLAHELGHLERGHRGQRAGLERAKRTSSAGMELCGPGVDPLTLIVGLVSCGVGLAGRGAAATLADYSREREREADAAAVERLAAAGYCAGPVMKQTVTELARLAPAADRTSVFATHPGYDERWRNAGGVCTPE